MASAAAVAADSDRSPLRNNIGEDLGIPGEVTSAIGSKELDGGSNGGINDEDEDEAVRATKRRRGPPEAPDVEDEDDERQAGDVGDDLFGDDEDGALEEEPEKPA